MGMDDLGLHDIYGKPQKTKNTIGLRVKIHGRKLAKLEPVRIHPACEIGFISSRVLIIHHVSQLYAVFVSPLVSLLPASLHDIQHTYSGL